MFPLITVLGISFHTFHLLLAVGIFASLMTLFAACRRKRLPLDFLADHFFIFFLAGALLARIVYGVVYRYPVWDIVFFWRDFSFHFPSALLGFGLAFLYLARRMMQPVRRWLDVFAITILPVLFFYNMGTFFAGTAYGKSTILPFGVAFTHPDSVIYTSIPVHPTQLYAAVLVLVTFVMAGVIYRSRALPGETFATVLLMMGGGLFLIGFFRGDSAITLLGLRLSQLEQLLMALGGGAVLGTLLFHKKSALKAEVTAPADADTHSPSHTHD